ncbi:VOC family protein [Streptomyces sp. NPDC002730]|uniref:VOC family protein n=1 Tax=Streptomyces sp. NPDC002730 TaxID=3364662 RepID=UPI0036ABDC51
MTTNSRPGDCLRARRDLVRPQDIHAAAAGASPAEVQPQDDARVLLDPAGHPFRLFIQG